VAPCWLHIQSLNPAERNYAIYDKELLSVIHGLEEWRHILEGTKHTVEILNDHKNLTYFQTAQNLNRHQACWSLYLSRFDYSLAHRAGRHSAKPDALSRCVDQQIEGEDNEDQGVLPAECFKNEHFEVKLTDQGIGANITKPSQVHIESEGSHFLDHVHGCTDWDESMVRALKELSSEVNLQGMNGKNAMAWSYLGGKSTSPWMGNSNTILLKPTTTPQ